jgi:hypothetical protein
MRAVTKKEILEHFPTVTEGALVSLMSKGYKYIIWSEKDEDPIFAKTFETMISAVKDAGKGAAAATIV